MDTSSSKTHLELTGGSSSHGLSSYHEKKWMLGVPSLEVYNSVLNIAMHDRVVVYTLG